ncbi:MAG: tetratricopeptide repeat protein [Armatimonadota bacterium]
MGTAFIFGPLIVGVLLLCGWSVYRLFGMMVVDRMLSIGEFLLIMGVIVALMMLTFMMAAQTNDPFVAVGPLILLAVVTGFIPLLPKLANTARGYQLLRADIRRYQEALKRQPDVPFPHMKLGDIYRQREDWDRAIEHYQAYIEAHDQSAEAKRHLKRCLERRRIRDMGLRRCPICGAENTRGHARCEECGFYLKGSAEIMATLVTPGMMVVWKWLIVAFLVPGLIIGLMADIIPPVVSVAMLSVSVIATFIFLYGRMSREGG